MATEYDTYEGKKNWNELSLDQRKRIIACEFGQNKEDYDTLIMSSGLKKPQAAGIRALFVSAYMFYRKDGHSAEDLSTSDLEQFLDFYSGTRFYAEMSGLLKGLGKETTSYDAKELEKLTLMGTNASPLDDAIDMPPIAAKQFVLSFLESEGKL